MSEVIRFPRMRRADEVPHRRVLVAGVHADLVVASGIPTGLVRVDCDLSLRYVPAWELQVRGQTADLRIEPQASTGPDRHVVLETIAGDLLEQDDDGRLWINAEPMDDGVLVEVGSAGDERARLPRAGDAAALLLATREPTSFRFSIQVTAPVLWVYSAPIVIAEHPVFTGWLRAAHVLCREQSG